MEIKIDTKSLDSFRNKVAQAENFFFFEMRPSQDANIDFEEFLYKLGISDGSGKDLTKENKGKLDVVRDFVSGEYNDGFRHGVYWLQRWIEATVMSDFETLKYIEHGLKPKESLDKLQRQRNELNRKIATLKKASLKSSK